MMEYEQETTIIDTRKENKLIERIKQKRKEFNEVKKQLNELYGLSEELPSVEMKFVQEEVFGLSISTQTFFIYNTISRKCFYLYY